MVTNATTTRHLVIYRGHVQGVGFRYTTQRIAGRFAVTGHVRNLPDGRVEVLVEGPAREVQSFLSEIRAALDDKIQDVDVHTLSATGEFKRFEIRY